MNLRVNGNGDGFEVHFKVSWHSFDAFVKAALAAASTIAAFLAAPAIVHWLGW